VSIEVAKAALRRVVLKAAAYEHEEWIKAGLPRGSGLDVRAMSWQMALLAEQINAWLKREQQLYVAYVKAHPPTLLPVAKASLKDLPPETALNYHAWLEDVTLRQQSYDPGTQTMTESSKTLQAILQQGLTEAVGTGGVSGLPAAGAAKPGFTSNLTRVQSQRLLKELAPLQDEDSMAARSMWSAVNLRLQNQGSNNAILRDGASRPLAVANWRNESDHMVIDSFGSLDASVPGSGLQLVRELANVATDKGLGIKAMPGPDSDAFWKGLGFEEQKYSGYYRLDPVKTMNLAQRVPDTGGAWTQVGFLEGPQGTYRAIDAAEVDALRTQVSEWGGLRGDLADSLLKDVQRNGSANVSGFFGPDGKLGGIMDHRFSEHTGMVEVSGIAVDPTSPKGAGVGRRMMREASAIAADDGHGITTWGATVSAGPFYERLGMKPQPNGEYVFDKDQTASFASGLTGSGVNFSGQISWELAVSGADEALRGTTIKRVVNQVSAETHQSLVNSLADGLSKGEGIDSLSQRVQQLGPAFNEVRGQRIARTEVITANRRGQLGIATDAGVQKKTWRSQVGSNRTRLWHRMANGQTVDIDKPFKVANSKGMIQELMVPGDCSRGATADNTINCRCAVRYEKKGVSDAKSLKQPDEHGTVDPEVKPPAPPVAVPVEKDLEMNLPAFVPPTWEEEARGIRAAGVVTNEDVQRLGNVLGDEIDSRMAAVEKVTLPLKQKVDSAREAMDKAEKDIAKVRARMRGKPDSVKAAAVNEAYKVYHAKTSQFFAARKDWETATQGQATRAEVAKELLAKVRPVGGDLQIQYGNGIKPQTATLKQATQVYPKDWVDTVPYTGSLKVYRTYPGAGTGRKSSCYLSNGIYLEPGDVSSERVARHELGHYFEDVVPGLHAKVAQYYEERTSAPTPENQLVWLGKGYASNEMTRKDNFWTDYAGKSYVSPDGTRYATELMSSAAEHLFGSLDYQAKIWSKDPESARFFLGLMAGV
jgi:uncharacterized protein with gpF-like domain/ribosomal protein S18 acetylase RimI-like enzyme